MRAFAVFRKSAKEQLREIWLVALILTMAPFFVLLYWLVFGGGGAFKPKIAVVNSDVAVVRANGERLHTGATIARALERAKGPNGEPSLVVVPADSRETAEKMVLDGKAVTMFVFPENLSAVMADWMDGERKTQTEIVFAGDLTNPTYLVGSVLAYAEAEVALHEQADVKTPVKFVEVPFGGSASRTDFEMALPGLFIFAVILLMFPTSMALAREAESGTLKRMQLSRMSSFDLLAGLSLFQVVVGIAAVLVAFGVAVALGFSSEGPMWSAILVAAVASLSCVGVGLIVACFSRTVTEAFIICNFPMILMMFFSGSMMPMPKMVAFSVGGLDVGIWDFMPTTHAVVALNKVLGLGLGFGDIVYEIVALCVLTALYFGAGVWLFRRRRLRAD